MKRLLTLTIAVVLPVSLLVGCGALAKQQAALSPDAAVVEKTAPVSTQAPAPETVAPETQAPTEATEAPTQPPTEAFQFDDGLIMAPTTDITVEELLPYVQLYNSCMYEQYGAQTNESVSYRQVFTSEDAAMAGELPIAVVGPEDARYESHNDPAFMQLYPVTNFSSLNALLENLKAFMTEELIAQFWLPFVEFEGKLYLTVGGMGTGAVLVGTEDPYITDLSESGCTLVADTLYFEENTGDALLHFVMHNGKLLLNSVELTY